MEGKDRVFKRIAVKTFNVEKMSGNWSVGVLLFHVWTVNSFQGISVGKFCWIKKLFGDEIIIMMLSCSKFSTMVVNNFESIGWEQVQSTARQVFLFIMRFCFRKVSLSFVYSVDYCFLLLLRGMASKYARSKLIIRSSEKTIIHHWKPELFPLSRLRNPWDEILVIPFVSSNRFKFSSRGFEEEPQ